MNAAKSLRSILVLSLIGVLAGSPLSVHAQAITGSISGLVLDANNDPIHINIPIAVSSVDGSFVDGLCTDSGYYQITGLPLGSYIVEAGGNGITCGSDYPYAREYWPNAPFINNASAVTLTTNFPDESGISFTLAPGGTIRGTVYETDGSILTNGRVSIALVFADPIARQSIPTEIYTCTDQFTAEYELKHIPLDFEYKMAANVFPCPNNAEGFATINAWPDSPTDSGGMILEPTTSTPTLTGKNFTIPLLGDTPSGSDVLTFTSTGFITFDSVSAAGSTTVELIDTNPPPTPPNFQTVGDYYDVSTSAAFTSAQVCFNYSAEGLTLDDELEIRLFHRESLVWVDVTDPGYPNTLDNVVCGTVSNFSPFVVARPGFHFSGFFQPVDNPPTLNLVKAGNAIPVKFSLDGDHGLAIFEEGYPKSQLIACDSTVFVDGIEETIVTGSSSLSYAAGVDQYFYVWKTDKSWAGTCRQLIVKLTDGTFHRANFTFK
jgi:hypothetical protein